MVDADEPPLRMFLGRTPLGVARHDYESRLATWNEWQPVSVAAYGKWPRAEGGQCPCGAGASTVDMPGILCDGPMLWAGRTRSAPRQAWRYISRTP